MSRKIHDLISVVSCLPIVRIAVVLLYILWCLYHWPLKVLLLWLSGLLLIFTQSRQSKMEFSLPLSLPPSGFYLQERFFSWKFPYQYSGLVLSLLLYSSTTVSNLFEQCRLPSTFLFVEHFSGPSRRSVSCQELEQLTEEHGDSLHYFLCWRGCWQ